MPEYKFERMEDLLDSDVYQEIIMEAILKADLDPYEWAEEVAKKARNAKVEATASVIETIEKEKVLDLGEIKDGDLEATVADSVMENILDTFLDYLGSDQLGVKIRWSGSLR